MKHKIDIWAKHKLTGRSHIAGHSEIDESDIEELALNKYIEGRTMLQEDVFEYYTRLDETII